MEDNAVTGIAYTRDEAQITLVRIADKPGVAASIFVPLARAGINVDMIVQTASNDKTTDLSFTVSKADFDRAMIALMKKSHIMLSLPPWLLWVDEVNKTIVYERNNFIFVFNWHASFALPDYEIPLRETGDYSVVLSTDDPAFGGLGRFDDSRPYPSYLNADGQPA